MSSCHFSKLNPRRIIRPFLGRAFWVTKIRQPGTAVELGVGRLDLALLVDVEDIDTLDFLDVVASAVDGDPAPANLVAAAERIQSLEIEWGLGAGCADEGRPAGEGDGSFL